MQAVDKELKRVCEDLILENAKAALEPVSSFLLKVSAFRLRNEARNLASKELLIRQTFAQPGIVAGINDNVDAVLATFEGFTKTVQSRFSTTVGKMNSYLGDRKTEAILIKVIKSHILDTYQGFYDLVSANYEFSVVSGVWTLEVLGELLGRLGRDVGIIVE
jgi:hypothetical protein